MITESGAESQPREAGLVGQRPEPRRASIQASLFAATAAGGLNRRRRMALRSKSDSRRTEATSRSTSCSKSQLASRHGRQQSAGLGQNVFLHKESVRIGHNPACRRIFDRQ